jgi:hypothetical protein
MSRAEIAKPRIVRLSFMILQRPQKRSVLNQDFSHLRPKKFASRFHFLSLRNAKQRVDLSIDARSVFASRNQITGETDRAKLVPTEGCIYTRKTLSLCTRKCAEASAHKSR